MKRCLYCHFWADIDSSPTQTGMIRGLAEAGVAVDLCHETRDFLLPPHLPERVHPIRVESWRTCGREVLSLAEARHSISPYAFALAVDGQGLSVALPVVKRLQIPLVYLSCELTFRDELTREGDIRLKELEIEGTRHAALIIIQDAERAGLLAAENGLDPARFAFLPNAPADGGQDLSSGHLRRALGIPSNRRIVLHAGSFDTWTAGRELIEAAHGWDERFILVVHTRQLPREGDFITRFLEKCDPARVRFSTKPLSFDAYGRVIDSCDIGLVLYQSAPTPYTQKNLRHIGLSSGKLAYFARHGKPVITTALPGYRRLIERYAIGRWVESVSSIGDVLLDMAPQLPRLGENNRRFFEDELDFARHFLQVLERIRAIL